MRGVEPAEDVRHDLRDETERRKMSAVLRGVDKLREALAVHVLHHQEQLAVGRDDVEHRNHVRMADPSGDAPLVSEHRDELGVLAVGRVEPLDRYGSLEPTGPIEPSDVHGCHAATRDLVCEDVPADSMGCRRRRHSHVEDIMARWLVMSSEV